MLKTLKTTPAATKDVLSQVCFARDKIKLSLLDFYKMRGFDRIETPVLEYYDVFDGSKANIPQQSMYKLTDSDGRLIVLRPDCTIPMARVASTRLKNAPRPIRLCYSQNVYTINPPHSPRSNETPQVGIEIMGDKSSKKADLEAVFLAAESLDRINKVIKGEKENPFDKKGFLETKSPKENPIFRLELCHIGYFKGIMDQLSASDEEKEEIRQLVEKKNYYALEKSLRPYKETKAYNALMLLPRLFGGIEVVKEARKNYINEKTDSALAYLEELYENLKLLGLEKIISVDLGMVNKSDYYTGIIFKGYFEGAGEEVLSGGRYDNLSEIYGSKMTAVGFGVNVSLTAELSDFEEEKNERVLIYGEKGFEAKALAYIESFCDEGVLAEYSVFETIEDTVSYAREKRFDKIMTVGKEIDYINI